MTKKLSNNIMIVDDSEENRMILQEMVNKLGYVHQSYDNAKDALDYLRQNSVDCILLDIKMPEMSGIEMLGLIKRDKHLSDIPIIMVTGVEDSKSIVDCITNGAQDYVTKPFEPEILSARIKGVIKRYEVYLNEKELVDKTFFGSVKLLNDLLSVLSPQIFGKSNQIRRIAKAICNEIEYKDTNDVELAALFSHIGCISLSSDILDKLVNGKFLLTEEKNIFDNHPLLGYKLLKNIPLLENVTNAILYQNKNYDGSGPPAMEKISAEDIPLPARILRGAIEYHYSKMRAGSTLELSEMLKTKESMFDPNIFKALQKVMVKDNTRDLKELKVNQLKVGMIFAEDIFTTTKIKVGGQWQEITDGILERISNIHIQIGVREPLKVFTN